MTAELDDPFPVALHVVAKNERGLLAKVASKISEAGANIENVTLNTHQTSVHIDAIIDVSDRVHLAHVFKNLRTLTNVKKITRHLGHKTKP